MKIGIIGRTNVGKSTLFKALTLEEVEIEDRPFTTIEPNKGVGYVTVECPEKYFNVKCNPHNAPCVDGTRFVPINIIDVAGLVEGASEGKGLGNKFLSDIMEADAIIEVIDISGNTDSSGNKTKDFDPGIDIEMVDNEIKKWIASIISRSRYVGKEDIADVIFKNVSGINIKYSTVKEVVKELDVKEINDDTALDMASLLMKKDKPMLILCNKMDSVEDLEERMKRLKERFDYQFMACSAAAELTIREAEKNGFIRFKNNRLEKLKELSSDQEKAIGIIEKIIKKYGGTGVREALNRLVFELKGYKVVFPVEDEKKLTDGFGRVLPDAYLVEKDATPKDVAAMIHSDIAKNYKGAIDCKTGLKVKNDSPVKNGQVLKILV
ncbi:MAG: YchF-related putative GTPase [Candidatus Parvarchaeota archaeon]|nr:YchF-related putative GTPase [Candidatus Parvarchaeota archaeon]MCW1295454.1 YchF-related putative GTPase [Candidatus Parvarchaeum tengchongense]MCW1299449.1 YchF-related putative GTPase [Candidatus Parvarchaeum tengchongense]MCW1312239.1 YchF-related putative GTPase [Candidatus Parvarchaeum tengchongense]